TLLGFIAKDDQFFAASVPDGSSEHHSIVQERRTYHRCVFIGDKQDLFELYLCSILGAQPIDFEPVTYRDFVLSSTTFNDCKHLVLFLLFSASTHSIESPGGYVGGVGGGLP